MSVAFRKDGKFQVWVPGIVGRKQRSTGTSDPVLARKIIRMVRELRESQDWEIISAIHANRISLPELYAAKASNRLPELRSRLGRIVLSDHLDGWVAWILANGGRSQTAATYRAQVTTLVTQGFVREDFTRPRISEWLSAIPSVTTGTRRKYLAALKSFIRYLHERGIIEHDPTFGVKSPKKNPPRDRWETEENDRAIVAASPLEYRALFAYIKATGAEVSPALKTLRGDLDLRRGLAHIRGTKNAHRNRHDAIIEPWALPILKEHGGALVGNVPLWPGITRYQAHRRHQEAAKALGIDDYTLRDARHSWAVRSRKRGESLEAIATQLGHKGIATAVEVYAQYRPELDERTTRKEVLLSK